MRESEVEQTQDTSNYCDYFAKRLDSNRYETYLLARRFLELAGNSATPRKGGRPATKRVVEYILRCGVGEANHGNTKRNGRSLSLR